MTLSELRAQLIARGASERTVERLLSNYIVDPAAVEYYIRLQRVLRNDESFTCEWYIHSTHLVVKEVVK